MFLIFKNKLCDVIRQRMSRDTNEYFCFIMDVDRVLLPTMSNRSPKSLLEVF